MHELFETLEEIYTPSEIVELLSDFNKDSLEEYALRHDICPKCFSPLIVVTWKEPQGEHFGRPVYEKITERRCELCGDNY